MQYFKVFTNEGIFYILTTREKIREKSMEYTKDKLSKGKSLAAIEYCFHPITIEKWRS